MALDVPAIVTVPHERLVRVAKATRSNDATASAPDARSANPITQADQKSAIPATADRKPAIVTIRSRKHAKHADPEELTPEEIKRRGDAAQALWRELVRRVAALCTPSIRIMHKSS
jgi:hypothetical protein